jgi:hypothetical protein
MNFYRRFSPTFWRFDFSVSVPIEVEEVYDPTGSAETLACPTCDQPVDANARLCHFCRLGFDSDACLAAHSSMAHQPAQPIAEEPLPKGVTAFCVSSRIAGRARRSRKLSD